MRRDVFSEKRDVENKTSHGLIAFYIQVPRNRTRWRSDAWEVCIFKVSRRCGCVTKFRIKTNKAVTLPRFGKTLFSKGRGGDVEAMAG